MLSSSNARLVAARRLTSRRTRHETGRFLAEGAPAVREALRAGVVEALFATAEAARRLPELLAEAGAAGVGVDEIGGKDAAALSETVSPQGVIAVCRRPDGSVEQLLAGSPRLVVLLVEPNDPGNLGAIIRTADAAGADAVVLDGGVDPYNGKVVRATAGSLFHLPVLACATEDLLAGTDHIGMVALATTGAGAVTLDGLIEDDTLRRPTIWIFGNEAAGLPNSVLESADHQVRVPIYGQAESLNLSNAAAVCLYASARAQHRPADPATPGR